MKTCFPDMLVPSAPPSQMTWRRTFGNPFGVQTLGVSARYTLRHNFRNWALHRVLFGLYNAEVYLRPRYLFRRENMRYLYSRRRDIADQIMHRMSLMVGGR